MRSANAITSFPHTEKAGRFDETRSGTIYTCIGESMALATWAHKGLFLKKMGIQSPFPRIA